MRRIHSLKIEHSMVVEVLSCIRAMALPEEHLEIKEAIDRIKSDMEISVQTTDQGESVLETIQRTSSLSFGLHEFLLVAPERDDVQVFFNQIKALPLDKKVVTFTGFGIVENEIDVFNADGKISSELRRELKAAKNLDIDQVCVLLESLDAYIDKYKDLALKIAASESFRSCFTDLVGLDIERAVDEMKSATERRHPTSYAQALMGKSFWNISDWIEHEFIPVYFNTPKMVRFFDADKNVMVRPLYKREVSGDALKLVLKDKLKLLSDPTRLSILRMTYMKPMYGKEIADALDLTTATVSHHLDLLRKSGMLNMEQDRHIKYFSTNTRAFNDLITEMNRYIKE